MTVRQMEVLRIVRDEYGNRLKEAQALEFNQIIFGSLCTRGWLDWNAAKDYFFVTLEGKRQLMRVESWMPLRKQLAGKLHFGLRAERAMRLAARHERVLA